MYNNWLSLVVNIAMERIASKLSILAVIVLLSAQCIDEPIYSVIPKIKDPVLNKNFLVKGIDSLIIRFGFTDGDGDIGVKEGEPGLIKYVISEFGCVLGEVGDPIDPLLYPIVDTVIGNVFLTDSRDGCTIYYRTPYIDPQSKYKAISGEITIDINKGLIQCLPGKQMDTLTYTIRLRDRYGHYSDPLTTDPIIIKCN